jgi:L-asparaginase
MNHVQASSRLVNVMVTAGVQGIVVAGTGNGAVSSSLLKGLQQAHKQGIQIRLATRCNQGPVLPTDGHAFKADSGLSPVKTRVALMLDMMSKQQSH